MSSPTLEITLNQQVKRRTAGVKPNIQKLIESENALFDVSWKFVLNSELVCWCTITRRDTEEKGGFFLITHNIVHRRVGIEIRVWFSDPKWFVAKQLKRSGQIKANLSLQHAEEFLSGNTLHYASGHFCPLRFATNMAFFTTLRSGQSTPNPATSAGDVLARTSLEILSVDSRLKL
jgi:hypothetical protein